MNEQTQRDAIVAQFTPESHSKFDARVTKHIAANNGFISPEVELSIAAVVLNEQQNPELFAIIFS